MSAWTEAEAKEKLRPWPKCWDENCNYPNCLCAPCLELRVFLARRVGDNGPPTVELSIQGADPKTALDLLEKAIEAATAELLAGKRKHLNQDAGTAMPITASQP